MTSGHTQEVCKDIEGKDSISKLVVRDVAARSTAVFVLKLQCSLNKTGPYAGSRPYLAHFTHSNVAGAHIDILSGTRSWTVEAACTSVSVN